MHVVAERVACAVGHRKNEWARVRRLVPLAGPNVWRFSRIGRVPQTAHSPRACAMQVLILYVHFHTHIRLVGIGALRPSHVVARVRVVRPAAYRLKLDLDEAIHVRARIIGSPCPRAVRRALKRAKPRRHGRLGELVAARKGVVPVREHLKPLLPQ